MKQKQVINGITRWIDVEPPPAPTKSQSARSNLRIHMGAVLREERQKANLSMRDLTNISISHVSQVERGIKEASSEMLLDMCNLIGVEISHVLRQTADRLDAPMELSR